MDKVRSRLTSWNNKHISFGDRMVLLKLVLISLLIYFFFFFKVPLGIILFLNLFLEVFYGVGRKLGDKIHWLAWERVCMEKEKRGLGIKYIKTFNITLWRNGGGV